MDFADYPSLTGPPFEELAPITMTNIKAIPTDERPRERCLREGPRCLSTRECLAIIIGTGPRGVGCFGVADNLIERYGNGESFFRSLDHSTSDDLLDIKGIGPTARSRLLACFELARRHSAHREQIAATDQLLHRSESSFESQISTKIPDRRRSESREWFGFVPLYPSGKIGELTITELGARTHVNVDPGEFFARVLVLRPSGIVLVHNHPSGELRASEDDRHLTLRIREICAQLGINLLGHAIVSSRGTRWI